MTGPETVQALNTENRPARAIGHFPSSGPAFRDGDALTVLSPCSNQPNGFGLQFEAPCQRECLTRDGG